MEWVKRQDRLPDHGKMCLVAVADEIDKHIYFLDYSESEDDENTETMVWYDVSTHGESFLESFDYWMYVDSIPKPEGE